MTLPSPYPGLRPFQAEEAHLFFGREVQVEDMLARLEDHWFLAVVGTSGCGKSSLVRAGLIPALEQGFLSDAKPNWRIAVMSPGSAPFDNLTTALLRAAALGHERQSASHQAASLLQATLRRGPLGLVEAVAESHLPEDTNLLLVVDQFEEIFRYRKQTQNVNDADAFVNLLLTSAQSQQSEVPMYVVITMRSDFIGDCALFTGLPEAINDSQFLTPRLTRDQYRSAIVEPALVAGGQLDDALVNQLLNDLRGEPDQLPVLQHALMRMWTLAGDDVLKRALTLDDYKAVGGLAGALSKHCDEILNELNPEQQRIAEVMFRALCERSSEQRDTRHPAQLGEVAAIAGVDVEAVVPVVDAFRDTGRNFLMPPLPIALDAERTLDISHESLIRQWQTLNTWVEAEAESARQYQRLEDVAKRRQQRGGAELWRGVDLENARDWKERQKPTEAWAARYGDAYQLAIDFLQASEAEEEKQRREHERAHQRELEQARERAEMQSARAEEQAARAAEQARAASRFKMTTVAVGVLLLLTIGVAIYAFIQQNKAADAQHVAMTAQQLAEKKEQEAIRVAKVAVVRLARYFSAESKASIEVQPTLSILLSIEALKIALIPAAEEALRDAITKIAANTTLVGHENGVVGVAFSPDGQVLATTSWDQTVRLWSLSNPTAEPRLLRGHEKAVYDVAFSLDGQVLATTSADQTVRLWSLSNPTAKPRVLRGHEKEVYGVAFSPDGQVLATTSVDQTVRLWSLSNPMAEPRVLRGHEKEVWDVAFSPDGQVLATASADQTVRLWSLSNPTAEPRVLRGHEKEVWGVAFSPDGQGLATASEDKTVRLWSLSNPTAKPRVLRGHENSVYGVAFSPDGQVLATASGDKTVRLWSLSNPTAEPRVLRGHENSVYGVAFSPDGQGLATASWDQTVRLWSLSNPTAEPRVLRGHENSVYGVTFSPDGQVLATASVDKTVRLWGMVIDDLVRIACQLTSGNFRHEEWQRYLGDEPYRKTCQNRPLHPSFLAIIRKQVKDGDVEGAVAKLHIALQVDGSSDVVPQKEARRLAAPALVEKGQELARGGDIDGAVVAFQQALELDPNLALDPEKEARQLASSGLVDKGLELAKQGAIREAMAAFEEAQAIDSNLEIAADAWNSLCWDGSLAGFATDVMAACERAVALEPDHGNIRDSRGVARALTEDYPGAINDFQRYLEWGPENGQSEEQIRQRQDWIRMLQANQNPFNKELLKLLRDE